jgi:aminotransferase
MAMRDRLNQALASAKPSPIREFTRLAAAKKDCVRLTLGEPDFITPEAIRAAANAALAAGETHYIENNGTAALRAAIAEYERVQNGMDYTPEEVVVTVGATEALFCALFGVLEPGDEVIIPTPSFVCYGPLVSMCQGVPVYLETRVEDEFRLTAELLKGAITPKTKALVLPYPCNPTGGVMERTDLEAIAGVLEGTDIVVISDEIYSELTYGGLHHVSIANIPGMQERTLLVNGFSKSYSMTGWRMGYLCGPRPLIGQIIKLHQYGIMSAPTTSQYAAIEALKNGDEDIEAMKAEYDGRRTFLLEGFRAMGLECFEPKGAFYMFPGIQSTGLSSDDFCMRFLEAEQVAVIPGSAFGPGGEGFVRCCYAASMQKLAAALERMEHFIKHR